MEMTKDDWENELEAGIIEMGDLGTKWAERGEYKLPSLAIKKLLEEAQVAKQQNLEWVEALAKKQVERISKNLH